MKILHTADLHLGRQFNGLALEEDQQAALDQVLAAVRDHDVDVLVIAGDVFDRAAPPAAAVRMFNAFLGRIASETRAAVVLIAGNHDSADRIEAMAVLTDRRRALVRGTLLADEPPLVLTDALGPVAFSGLPFAYEYAARATFADETLQSPQDVLAAQVAAARRHVPAGARWVLVAHAFVSGALGSEGERSLTRVGGIETVDPAIFAGADYVALGHLHRPQEIAPGIRYAGAPLAFGFDEAGAQKSMCLVTLEAGVTVQLLPFAPLRQVRLLRGLFAELLALPPSDDILRLVLTDPHPVLDGMKRLREVFPNACELAYARDERAPEIKALTGGPPPAAGPVEVLADFLQLVRDAGPSAAEAAVLADALGHLGEGAA